MKHILPSVPMLRSGFTFVLVVCLFVSGNTSTIFETIPTPAGCKRDTYPERSYAYWVQHLSLKDTNSVLLFDSSEYTAPNILAVVDKPLLYAANIEDCADYCVRFWTEYHREHNILKRLFLFDSVGNKVYYKDDGGPIMQFLKAAIEGADSKSLRIGCKTLNTSDCRPGDMFLQYGSNRVDFTALICDVCRDSLGTPYYLIGCTNSPAQEMHIEKAPPEYGRAGWFSQGGAIYYFGAILDYGFLVARRFR